MACPPSSPTQTTPTSAPAAAIAKGSKDVLKINDYVGLHPSLAPLKAMYDDGHLGIVQGVGYPNPNRSHFRATDIWSSAQPDREAVTSGWVGRYFDNACPGCRPPRRHVDRQRACRWRCKASASIPLSIERPEAYRYQGARTATSLREAEQRHGSAPSTQPGVLLLPNTDGRDDQVPQEGRDHPGQPARLPRAHRHGRPGEQRRDPPLGQQPLASAANVPRQSELGQRLQTVAAMISGNGCRRASTTSAWAASTPTPNRQPRHDRLMDADGRRALARSGPTSSGPATRTASA